MHKSRLDIKILDGGFSAQVIKNETTKNPTNISDDPLWTARLLETDPVAVIKTHLDFLRAGSEFISTNTYQASIDGFMKHLHLKEEEACELMRKASMLANEAVNLYLKESPDKKATIVGSIGPYGAALHDASEYSGNYIDGLSIEDLQKWHRPRITELFNCGVKYFAFETLPCQKEAEALAELLKEYPDAKAWISFTCKDDKNLPHGECFQVAVKTCFDRNPQQLVAVGLNCLNPNIVEKLIAGINEDRIDNPIPLIVYPNRGETYSNGRWIQTEANCPIENYVERWINMGIKYIGGCCRVDAEDIKKIKKSVSFWSLQDQLNKT